MLVYMRADNHLLCRVILIMRRQRRHEMKISASFFLGELLWSLLFHIFILLFSEFIIPVGECFYFQLNKETSYEISKVRK